MFRNQIVRAIVRAMGSFEVSETEIEDRIGSLLKLRTKEVAFVSDVNNDMAFRRPASHGSNTCMSVLKGETMQDSRQNAAASHGTVCLQKGSGVD